MTCIDFYSGIGGWTLGMKLSNIDHIKSFEWNIDSNTTHNINFETNNKEIDIRKLDFKTLPKTGSIDFIVGSPPCTQFSYSNKGGSGNIQDGLIDMYQFLKVVDYLKPKYWAMENVPRVKKILEKVLNEDIKFKKFKKLFNYLEVVDFSDYGLPQKRKRMIGGNFPHKLFKSYKNKTNEKTLGDILKSINNKTIIDPTYNYKLSKTKLSDNIKEDFLNNDELRINRESKQYHTVYNLMSFPERLDKPSRTITSTCTRVSRESLVIEDKNKFRRLTVRERAILMGFPITFQFYGKTFTSKLKMIGNAIPPVITYYIFQSMLEIPVEKLILIENVNIYNHKIPTTPIPVTNPDKLKFKYRDVRSFRMCIPDYRFGSGVRFELSNSFLDTTCEWKIRFFYGSSKQINEVYFTNKNHKKILKILKKQGINLESEIKKISNYANTISSCNLQKRWAHKSLKYTHPFSVLDKISKLGINIKRCLLKTEISDSEFNSLVGENLNSKLFQNKALVISGIILGHVFNKSIKK